MSAHAKSKLGFDELINHTADIFQALSHPLRLSICLQLIESERSVSQLCIALRQQQHSISQHLALLRKQNMVVARKVSRQVFYSVDDPCVAKVLRVIGMSLAELNDDDSGVSQVAASRGKSQPASEAGNFATVFTPKVELWSKHEKRK
jgi:DNA-binding transcriptional ArsR family regulator